MDLPDASGCLAGCDCILAPAAAPDEARAAAAACPVWVHAYDVGHAHIVQGLDEPLRDLLGAGGVLFCAVEVGGAEWAYGGSRKDGSGVYACPPKKNKTPKASQGRIRRAMIAPAPRASIPSTAGSVDQGLSSPDDTRTPSW